RHTRFDCDWSSDVCSSDLVAGGGARADQELPRAEPARSRDPGAGKDPRGTRPPGRLRVADDDQGDRQAHPDRADPPDPEPAADEIGRASCRERVEVTGVAE